MRWLAFLSKLGDNGGQKILADYIPQNHKELDMT